MFNVSAEAMRSVACFGLAAAAILIAIREDLDVFARVPFWLVGLSSITGCAFSLQEVLRLHGRDLRFLVPSSAYLSVGITLFLLSLLFSSGQEANRSLVAFGIAALVFSVVCAIYYNVKGLGVADGIAVSIVQSCLAAIIVAVALLVAYASLTAGSRRRRIR